MDNVHGAHGTASVVKHPLLIGVDMRRSLLVELGNDVLHHGPGVAAVLSQRALRQVVQVLQIKDVELVEVLLQHVENRRQESGQEAEDAQEPADAGLRLRLGHGEYKGENESTGREPSEEITTAQLTLPDTLEMRDRNAPSLPKQGDFRTGPCSSDS